MIVLINYLTLPTPQRRSLAELDLIAKSAQTLSLYQFYACPFCVKTRRAIHRLNIPMTLKDAKSEPYRTELEEGGGKIQAPCLRIDSEEGAEWLYDSKQIITYLEQRFADL